MDINHLAGLFGLDGKVALITGAAAGIGLATAESLARAGAAVVLSDRDGAAAESSAEGLRAKGLDVTALTIDVVDPRSVEAGVATAASWRGRLDIVFANAGNQDRKPFEAMPPETWRAIIECHVTGTYEVLRHAMAHLRASGDGRAVLMSSVTAFGVPTGSPIVAYATAKGGLAAMTRALAVEYGPQGVNINAVAPGYVRTGFTRALHDDAKFETWIEHQVPQGGWVDVGAVAAAVLYLVGPSTAHVTGVVLPVDRGLTAAL